MKKLFIGVFNLLLAVSVSAETIPFQYEFDLKDYKGQTYLSFMESTVKPAMDDLAINGYQVKGGDAVEFAYWHSDTKVRRRVERTWGGLNHVKDIADQLEGETVTLNTLPGRINSVNRGNDIYNLSTFLGLASGGGVSIKYAEDNYALNVHYDVEEERSGRSFGVSPTRKANDASDTNYLQDLQKYISHEQDDLKDFYQGLLESLLNSDSSQYPEVRPMGQAVLTDFLAVFTAEQARNLMDGHLRPHWDAALMEVTLLGSFHAGQEEIKLFYKNPGTGEVTFTDTTLKQTPCAIPTRTQRAAMRDYWQFSRNIRSEANCRRSGINVTKKEFQLLSKKITKYVQDNNPELYQAVKDSLKIRRRNAYNLYNELSKFLIDSDAPRAISQDEVDALTGTWIEFLEYVRTQAPAITAAIEAEQSAN